MSSSTDPPATTAAPLPAAGKSPALAPIKALAPLTSLPPMHTNTDNETSTPSGETNAEQPQQTFSADDDVGDVARMRNEHLLHQRWTFWYDLKDQGKPNHASWGASLKKLMDLESVEQFFGMVNNVAKPSALPVGSDYHLFKYGVKPEWEDPQNRSGGKWVYEMRKTDDVNEMDKLWLNTLLAIIGENFTDEDEVNGVVISLRKGRNRIGLWTKHDHAKVAQRVGAEWKKILMLPQTQRIGFTSHSQAMKSRDIQNLYTV